MTSKLFIPTFLYIKQHTITGKMYFGKTTKTNPESYTGSGKHWLRHIKAHGKEHVVTLWYCLFLDRESCTEFATIFSKNHNIVDSDEWLNLKDENGLDGNPIGTRHSNETKQKIGIASSKRTLSPEHKEKLQSGRRRSTNSIEHNSIISSKLKGRIFSDEHRAKLRKAWEIRRNRD